VTATAAWYVERLGFTLLFVDAEPARYAVLRRGDVEIHLQWHDVETFRASDGDAPAYRFLVDDPDALFAEVGPQDVLAPGAAVRDTPWGTREFGVYDPNGMALAFYRSRDA
jgi:catechol 2,3-dioxygenase-like lactoylglutathione lyase family enzyme